MLKYDRILITLLFASFVGKLLIKGASLNEALVTLILAGCYFLFHYKLQQDEITQLNQRLNDQDALLKLVKKDQEDMKNAVAAVKITQGLRNVR